MTKYIENVNQYITGLKIKQTYVSMKADIDTKKLSRILTGKQDITGTDMEKIAEALGKDVAFFIREPFIVPSEVENPSEKIAFYAGEPTEKQQKIADRLLDLMENIDEVLSAKGRFTGIAEE